MAEQKCSNCGRDLPAELGQHSIAPVSGLVTCPHCGAEVHLDKEKALDSSRPDVGDTFTGNEESETFSGSETIEDVKQELEKKPD